MVLELLKEYWITYLPKGRSTSKNNVHSLDRFLRDRFPSTASTIHVIQQCV